jgi:hypothetical protein
MGISAKASYVYTGTEWVPFGPQISYITSRWTKTAVGSETTLSGLDNNNNTLDYDVNYEQVYLNGVLLVRNVDYTATTGTSIAGLTALTAGDIVEIMTFRATQIANTYTQTQIDAQFATKAELTGAVLNPFFLPGM